MALEFSILTGGTGTYKTDVGSVINQVMATYGAGSPEVLNILDHGFLTGFFLHIIWYENQRNGTVNQYVDMPTMVARDSHVFSDCIDGTPADEYIKNILIGSGYIQTSGTDVKFSINVTWNNISDYRWPISTGLDSGNLAACMNNNWSVGLDVTPYTCDVVPCGSTCAVFPFPLPGILC